MSLPNIEALWGANVPDALEHAVGSEKPRGLLPLLELLSKEPVTKDLSADVKYIKARDAIQKDPRRRVAAHVTTLKLFDGDPTILSLLQGAYDPALVAEIASGITDFARQELEKARAMGTEATMSPSQRRFLISYILEDLQGMVGIEPGMPRSIAMRKINDFVVRAITDPLQTDAGYVSLLLNGAGMDAPTASWLMPEAVQKVKKTSETMRMLTSSTRTEEVVAASLPSGQEMEAVATAMETRVNILMRDGTTIKPVDISIAKAMDFNFGHFGEIKKQNGEPLYVSSSRHTPFRMSQLNIADRTTALTDPTLLPLLTYSPLEPKTTFLMENEYTNMPAENALTMPAFEWVDSGSRDWVEYLLVDSGVNPAEILAIDVDVPTGSGSVTPKAGAADMQPLTLDHPRVKGKLKDLTDPAFGLTTAEIQKGIGRYMFYESMAVRFSAMKNVTAAMFDVGNETVLFDPAQRKSETPDPLTKAIGNIAYLDKYQLFQMDVRQLTLAMYAPITGQKEGYWPIDQALRGKQRNLRFREPLGIGNWPELKPIKLTNGGVLPEETKTLIKDLFFARRRHRNDVTRDYLEANKLVKSAKAGANSSELEKMAQEIRLERIGNFEARAEVFIPRSRQDMFAMIMSMSSQERVQLRDVDFKGYLESMGYSNMTLSTEEYQGWFGLLKAAEIHSFRHYDWGDTHKLIAKQMKYLTDAGQNFYALMGLCKEITNSLTAQWQQIVGVNIEKYIRAGSIFEPDKAVDAVIKMVAEEVAMHVRTTGDANEYFKKMIESMGKVADISFRSPIGQRAILKATIDLVDTLIGGFESSIMYDELKRGKGEPGTQRKLLELNLAKSEDQRALSALRAAGYRVVVPGNDLKPYVTSGDGNPAYSIKGRWDAVNRKWEPEKGRKTPLAIYRHLGREAALVSVVMLYMMDQGLATTEDARTLLQNVYKKNR